MPVRKYTLVAQVLPGYSNEYSDVVFYASEVDLADESFEMQHGLMNLNALSGFLPDYAELCEDSTDPLTLKRKDVLSTLEALIDRWDLIEKALLEEYEIDALDPWLMEMT